MCVLSKRCAIQSRGRRARIFARPSRPKDLRYIHFRFIVIFIFERVNQQQQRSYSHDILLGAKAAYSATLFFCWFNRDFMYIVVEQIYFPSKNDEIVSIAITFSIKCILSEILCQDFIVKKINIFST